MKGKDFDYSLSPVRFLLLDRSYDNIIPLLHDYRYQAMSFDLLNIKDYNYYYDSNTYGGKTSKKRGKIQDSDKLWKMTKY